MVKFPNISIKDFENFTKEKIVELFKEVKVDEDTLESKMEL